MLEIERLPFIGVGEQVALAEEVVDGKVRCESVIGEDEHVRCARVRFDLIPQMADGHTFPARVELRPLRHAVDVVGVRLGRHGPDLVPGPGPLLGNESPHVEVPVTEIHVGHHPCVEDREALRHVLTRRHASRIDAFGFELFAIPGEERHARHATPAK